MSCITLMMISITSLLMIFSSMLSKKTMKDREKSSPFECGFDPFKTARIPFSLNFFLIAIIFLIFDVEITLLLPVPLLLIKTKSITPLIMSMFFFIFLLVGLYYEWFKGALNWSK